MNRLSGIAGRLAPHFAWAALFLLVTALLHLMIPATLDADTAYHFAVARYTHKYGILQEFPWTRFSWLAEHYADKELLFHLLMVPLANLDLVWASRIVGIALGTTLLTTLYLILAKERVEGAGVWALIALVSSSGFVYRLCTVRPHLLSIPLAMLVVWAAARERWWLLFLAGLLYPLSYTAWHLPLVLVGIVELARLATHRRLAWKPWAAVLASVSLGVLLHPNFPRNLELLWIQNFRVLFEVAWSAKAGFELGQEFDPFGAKDYWRLALIPSLFSVVAAARSWRRGERDLLLRSVSLAALAFLALTLRTSRFIEYLSPLSCLALGLSIRGARWPWLRVALLALCLLHLAVFARDPILTMRLRGDEFPPRVAQELRAAIPEGAQVVTCDWGMTGSMLLALPERHFLVALDPVFFWILDRERYRTWYETVNEPPPEPALLLRDTFDAQFVLCDIRPKWRRLHEALGADPAARLRTAAGLWRLYELRPRQYDPPPASPSE